MAQGKRKLYRIYLDNRYVAQESATSQAAAIRAYKAKEGEGNLRFYKVQAEAASSARKNPTKKQKREKSRKEGVKRRVATALAKFLKQANPAMKTAGATVTRLKGGGFTIRPIKANAGGENFIRMQMCSDGRIRAVYADRNGEFVRIDGRKVRRF